MFTSPNMSPVTCHLSPVACRLSPVTCHLSPVTCHLSPVTCHLLHVIYFFYFFFYVKKKIGQSSGACRWRVCDQRGLPRLVFANSSNNPLVQSGREPRDPVQQGRRLLSDRRQQEVILGIASSICRD
jgi:hypothetical protein